MNSASRGFAARLAFAACSVVLCASCGTAYRPVASPRIALVVHGGGIYYLKGDRESPLGPLGGDLEALVVGDAEAVRLARRARHELTFGVPAYVLGVAAVVAGLAIAKPAGWALAGGGLGTAGVGLGLMGAGVVNAVDAVNVYNDGVSRPP